MGLIIFHAGMAKAGSSSIQRWLGDHIDVLRSESGIQPVRVVQASPDEPIDLVAPSKPCKIKSKLVPGLERRESRAPIANRIFELLDAHTRRSGTIVVSCEGYQILFWDGDERVFADLETLARSHTVRVAYYVRPQHTSLESAWRQWGFRHPVYKPSEYISRQGPRLQYLQTLEAVRQAAPSVSFEMRPFRGDLLDGGDVVNDFASVFLGVHDVPPPDSEERWSNRGFPLELAILLRDAPPDVFWSSSRARSIHDNRTLDRLRDVVNQWDIPEGDAALESRLVLQRYSHRTFESANKKLIARLGWETPYFVPPVDDGLDDDPAAGDLSRLDALWRSSASEAQRQLVFCALRELTR